MQQTSDGVGKSRLAAPAFACKTQNVPAIQRNAHVVQGMHCTAGGIIIDAQITNIQQRSSFCTGRRFYKLGAHHPTAFLRLSACDLCGFDSLRRRGLAISSMPKLTKVRAAPNMAM